MKDSLDEIPEIKTGADLLAFLRLQETLAVDESSTLKAAARSAAAAASFITRKGHSHLYHSTIAIEYLRWAKNENGPCAYIFASSAIFPQNVAYLQGQIDSWAPLLAQLAEEKLKTVGSGASPVVVAHLQKLTDLKSKGI